MRLRKRLFDEVFNEATWLAKRAEKLVQRRVNGSTGDLSDEVLTSCTEPLFPTALQILGCTPPRFVEETQNQSRDPRSPNVSDPICTMEAPNPFPLETPEANTFSSRRKPQVASLYAPNVEFGDEVEIEEFHNSMLLRVASEKQPLEKESLCWLSHPFENQILIMNILISAQDAERALDLLGDPAPLSPIIQPNIQFHPKRNRRKNCCFHRVRSGISDSQQQLSPPPLESTSAASHSVNRPDFRAHRSAIDVDEPSSSPPLCSCANEGLLEGYARLFTSIEPGSTESLRNQHDLFLTKLGICSTCGGLHYFPYSAFEVLLSHDVVTLADLCEKYPLPPSTDVYCDGPRITACIVTRSPSHEWQVFQSLVAANCQIFSLHDYCSIHFWPGRQATESYWSKGVATSLLNMNLDSGESGRNLSHESLLEPFERNRVCVPANSTPLFPPEQYFLNLVNAKPSPWSSAITAFAARTLRRPYCIRRRQISQSDLAAAWKSIKPEACESLELTHTDKKTDPRTLEMQNEIERLRLQLATVTKEVQATREEALALGPMCHRLFS